LGNREGVPTGVSTPVNVYFSKILLVLPKLSIMIQRNSPGVTDTRHDQLSILAIWRTYLTNFPEAPEGCRVLSGDGILD
jgi:hypothetical protein